MTAATAAPLSPPISRHARDSSPLLSASEPAVGARSRLDVMDDHAPTAPAGRTTFPRASAPTAAASHAAWPRAGATPALAAPSVISAVDAKGKSALVKTYGYTAAGLGISCAAGAVAAAAFPPMGAAGAAVSLATALGSMVGVCGIPPWQSLAKHACWLGFTVSMGVMMSPLAVVGAPILAQAALLTTGVAAVLTGTAMFMPAGSFSSWEGPLMAALTGIVGVGLATMFMPASWAIAQAGHQVMLWGGLAVFTGYMLADTNGLCERANQPQFDAMRESMDIYLNLLNLFVRFVDLLDR